MQTGFRRPLRTHLAYTYPLVPDVDPDADLYQAGFFSPAEKKDIARFHGAGPFEDMDQAGLSRVLDTLVTPRVKALGTRILARNYHLAANPEFAAHLAFLKRGKKIAGYRSDEKYTLPSAIADATALEAKKQTLDERQQQALAQLQACLSRWPDCPGPAE
jgi:exodeoxyribonuclease I